MGKVSASKPMRDATLAALTSDVSIKRGGKSVKAKRLAVIADMLVTLAADGMRAQAGGPCGGGRRPGLGALQESRQRRGR